MKEFEEQVGNDGKLNSIKTELVGSPVVAPYVGFDFLGGFALLSHLIPFRMHRSRESRRANETAGRGGGSVDGGFVALADARLESGIFREKDHGAWIVGEEDCGRRFGTPKYRQWQ